MASGGGLGRRALFRSPSLIEKPFAREESRRDEQREGDGFQAADAPGNRGSTRREKRDGPRPAASLSPHERRDERPERCEAENARRDFEVEPQPPKRGACNDPEKARVTLDVLSRGPHESASTKEIPRIAERDVGIVVVEEPQGIKEREACGGGEDPGEERRRESLRAARVEAAPVTAHRASSGNACCIQPMGRGSMHEKSLRVASASHDRPRSNIVAGGPDPGSNTDVNLFDPPAKPIRQ